MPQACIHGIFLGPEHLAPCGGVDINADRSTAVAVILLSWTGVIGTTGQTAGHRPAGTILSHTVVLQYH
jgi:hypothetical protein